ncbi:DUF5017 domain-containing protein [Pseudopedobacter beijingensis]|uniref:DUF5017 domain-containing protein n=1 Tax=Pseudopedobacter beijingensis TaxID=1207056 RepID=A0ABW4I916_9SPHI
MRTILLVLIVFTCFSCQKLEKITMPDFEVELSKQNYHVGDTVLFNFKGDADVISVYTGEVGHNYDSINGRMMSSKFNVIFESHALDGTQRDQIYIYLLKEFNGDYSMAGVDAARPSMIELNDRLRTATPDDNRQWISSGYGDITEYLDMSEPSTIYFAVRHLVRNQNVYGTGNLNRVRNFKLFAINELDKEETVFSQAVDNWTLFSSANKMPGRASLDATNPPQMTLRNSTGASYVTETTEDWVISNPIQITPVVDAGPDRAIGVKSMANAMPKTYTKIYNKAGDYKVVFKAINQSAAGRKEVLREVNIHVAP